MPINSPSPGTDSLRFLASHEALDALSGRVGAADAGLDRSRIGGADTSAPDGEAVLAMNVWDGASSRHLETNAPAPVVSPGTDGSASVERAIDYVLAPLA